MMLHRQKVILAVLCRAKQPLSSTVLVKLAFLLRAEHSLQERISYYGFLPYKYGPFSFSLYRDLVLLARDGYLGVHEDRVAFARGAVRRAHAKAAELSGAVRLAVDAVVERYGRLPRRELLTDVYSRYPWYATRSELSDLVPEVLPVPNPAPVAVYTVGYEGESVDSFFNGLLKAGIRSLVDVRANPVSRKYGFARKSLRGIAEKLRIEYRHMPSLGIPREYRADLGDLRSYQRLLDRYEKHMLPRRSKEINSLGEILSKLPSALMCVEKDVQRCHRGRLARAVSDVSRLPVKHL